MAAYRLNSACHSVAQFQVMSNFGFELFNNYLKSGELTTSSTRSMMYMYRFPEDIKTWIIGDGYFENPYMPGYYYMRTDIGFLGSENKIHYS